MPAGAAAAAAKFPLASLSLPELLPPVAPALAPVATCDHSDPSVLLKVATPPFLLFDDGAAELETAAEPETLAETGVADAAVGVTEAAGAEDCAAAAVMSTRRVERVEKRISAGLDCVR